MKNEKLFLLSEIMRAAAEGKHVICRHKGSKPKGKWHAAPEEGWNFREYDYKIGKPKPDKINWIHVSKEWNWMARDGNGCVKFYQTKPVINPDNWEWSWLEADEEEPTAFMEGFSSYRRGNLSWKESLVERK